MVRKIFGLQFAKKGLINQDDVTLSVVRPESPGAVAGLLVGDVVLRIGGGPVLTRSAAIEALATTVANGKPLEVQVLRGLPNPYISHPRLDLFVGSTSPHKMQEVGCTICHEGQGNGTDFKWASHSPNDPAQGEQWMHEYGWFNNHHWIFPMNPQRFAESSCLKCHHEVAELEPSPRFPDPPAPTLTAGHDVIRQFGCYGCHEINGYDGPNRRIGPDMRVEPNYSAAAQGLLALGQLDDQQKSLADQLTYHPDDAKARRSLLQSLRLIEAATAAAAREAVEKGEAPVPPTREAGASKKLTDLLEDVESPGRLRKVGPSLRHVASKVDFSFLYSWIRKPADFRPSTRMPQFFGLWDTLDGVGLEQSKKFEPMEIRGFSEFLLAKSQPFYIRRSTEGRHGRSLGRTGQEAVRDARLPGLPPACRFPECQDEARAGPVESARKLNTPGNADGPKWLYSWLQNPSAYHPRTLMPNLILEPLTGARRQGHRSGRRHRDVSACSQRDWKPTDIPARELNDEQQGPDRSGPRPFAGIVASLAGEAISEVRHSRSAAREISRETRSSCWRTLLGITSCCSTSDGARSASMAARAATISRAMKT